MKIYVLSILLLCLSIKGYTQKEEDGELNKSKTFSLSGFNAGLKDGDTVELKICDAAHASRIFFLDERSVDQYKRIFKAVAKNGHFAFSKKELTRVAYCKLVFHPENLGYSDIELIEPGDDINIIFSNSTRNGITKRNRLITGKGSPKYNFRAIVDTLVLKKHGVWEGTPQITFKVGPKNSIMKQGVEEWTRRSAANIKFGVIQKKIRLDTCLSILEHFKSELSPLIYNVLKADVLGEYIYTTFERGLLFDVIDLLRLRLRGDLSTESLKIIDVELEELKKLFAVSRVDFDKYGVSEKGLNLSISADQGLLSMIDIDGLLSGISMDERFDAIAKITPLSFREKVFICFFLNNNGYLKQPEMLINLARPMIKNPDNIKVFSAIEKTGKGMSAYNFNLQDENGKLVSMESLKGKIVLMDFWYVGCGACKNYYDLTLKDVERQFRDNKDVVFITISPTKRREWLTEGLGKFTSKQEPNVINLNAGEEGYNAAVIRHYNISSYPFPLLIDKQGKIIENNQMLLKNKEALVAAIKNALGKVIVPKASNE
ncbi:hypothetical protein DBR43_09865 [Pedobacter sp. KBW06]|uniref:TlpA family protein disulfide reductase n=1 Tax=Pedobacter sp. KBW06 TaxID=2153359 RepID=UPI000F5A3097|nr:TlpA disulfide reductase family protein [Pedobacter sp. KBW06]RQO75634.1 hypothetical protein DBR43_09865 [Pedobacter sp. KBW06]